MSAGKCQSLLRDSRGSSVSAVTALGLLSGALFTTRGETLDSTPSDSTFSVNGDLVVVPVPVSDQNRHTVLGLTSDDFTVLDDKVRQDIVSFSRREGPSSIGVIFDVSGCMGGTENVALMAARVLTDDARPDDERFLITFAVVPRLEVEMRRDLNRIPDRLSFSGRQGATALFDAVAMGLHHLKGALVVVTDGGDNRGPVSFGELLSRSLEADVQVYVIAIRRNVRDLDEQRRRLQLDRLAAETGGRLFTIDAASRLKETMPSVGELIRVQAALWCSEW